MEIIFQFNERYAAGNLNLLSSQQEVGEWLEVCYI